MRNITKLAVYFALLATQVNAPKLGFGTIADADQPKTPAASVYEVKLNTSSITPVEVVGPSRPDYDTDVLNPLHAAQAAEAAQAQAAADAAAKAAAAKRTRVSVVRPVVTVTVVGSHADWMTAAGIAPSDFGYVDYIVSHESGWGVTKWSRAGSGAYGLGQAFPASKMAPYGADYLTNPVTQLKWANAYAVGKYGSWAAAYSHWLAYHSW